MKEKKEKNRDYYIEKSKKKWAIANAAGQTSTMFLIAAVVIGTVGIIFSVGCDKNIAKARKYQNETK